MTERLRTIHPDSTLGFDRTVPPAAVNRRSTGEVFVTDSDRVAPDEFVVALRVPRGHALWSDLRAPWHDTVSTVEAFRQAFAVVRHEYLDIPRGTPSSLQRVALSVDDLDVYRDDGVSPLDGVVRVRVTRSGARGAFDIAGTFTVGSAVAMTLSFSSILIPRASYAEIRAYQRSRKPAGGAPSPEAGRVDPASVGRRDPANVVIGRAASRPDRFPVVVDRTHPSFFDRDYDHVPGSLLIEAMRQGVLVTSGEAGLLPADATITRAEFDFQAFVELDAPAECTVSVTGGPAPRVAASVGVDQHGGRVAGGTLELTAYE
ncbi:MAG: AfsA-related hotdog domain-containing protein [Actinoallomurus sp.]